MASVKNIKAFSRMGRSSLYAAMVMLSASGCAITGSGIPDTATADELVTNSVVAKNKPDGVAEADANIIKNAVVNGAAIPLAWSNPDTGSSGTIVAIEKFIGKHGQNCRGFKTSVSSYTGIGYYNGETCAIKDDRWVLSWFKSSDG